MSKLMTRKSLPSEYQNLDDWPMVDADALSIEKRAHFERYKAAIEAYVTGAKLSFIKERYHIDAGSLQKALTRCLETASDGLIFGWRAIIFGARVKAYERTTSSLNWNGKAGLTGTFSKLLVDHPKIESGLVDHIKKKSRKSDRVPEAGSAFSGIYQKFKDLCQAEGLGPRDYPFTTVSMGSASLRRFIKRVLQSNFKTGARILGGKDAASKAVVGVGIARFLKAERPYDTWELDEHNLDFLCTVRIHTPTGPQYIPMNRMVLIVVSDSNSRCIVGYHVAIKKQPSAEDIVLAVTAALERWAPRKLIVDYVRYKPDAGLPSGVIPELLGVCAAELRIDNAMSHWSNAMITRIRDQTGMSLNWGPIARWERRNVVESIFGILTQKGFQRLPSTLGSGPNDPRVDDPVGKAIKHMMEFEELLDIVDVSLANCNANSSKAFSGLSSLSILKEYIEYEDEGFLPRKLPALPSHVPSMKTIIVTKRIRGSQTEGGTPYVEYAYARYSSPALAQAAVLIGKGIRLHMDPNDPRFARAFFDDGSELGVLTARGCWGISPHTLDMRIEAGRLMRNGQLKKLSDEDIFSAYMRHLLEKAVKQNSESKGRKKISTAATKVANIARVTGMPLPIVDIAETARKEALLIPSAGPDAKWPSFLQKPNFNNKAG